MDMNLLTQILGIAFEKKVSDIHFEVDNPPFFRVRGQLVRARLPNLTPQDTEFIATTILQHNGRTVSADLRELDAAYALPGGGRFRVSIFRQRGSFGIVMRVIPPQVGTFEELGLPPVLAEIARAPNGLILVTGPTGNGKSTTLASMLRYLNDSYNFNIVTIEDPVSSSSPPARAASCSARSGSTPRASGRRCARRCGWTRTSSWSGRCGISRRSRPASGPPKPATSCCRRCTRKAPSPPSAA